MNQRLLQPTVRKQLSYCTETISPSFIWFITLLHTSLYNRIFSLRNWNSNSPTLNHGNSRHGICCFRSFTTEKIRKTTYMTNLHKAHTSCDQSRKELLPKQLPHCIKTIVALFKISTTKTTVTLYMPAHVTVWLKQHNNWRVVSHRSRPSAHHPQKQAKTE
jgi:hypothetical protein